MSDVIWRERPQLREPVLVCAFKGWNDAGEAASSALSFIRSTFDAAEFAEIDPEEYYDFTAVRPNVRLTEGLTREIEWPAQQLLRGRGARRGGRPRAAGGHRALAALAALHRGGGGERPGAWACAW